MQVLIVPDSFKGTLSADEAAQAMAEAVVELFPDATIGKFPMADGGEGSSKIAGELLGAKRVEKSVVGPEGIQVSGFYYRTEKVAFIELAAASGFALSKAPKLSGISATTYGTGELILDAIRAGVKEVRLFLGGSATTDAGLGFASALGAEFYDASGSRLFQEGSANTLAEQIAQIAKIDLSATRELLLGCKITAAVDVSNPLCGLNGAAHIYGPQKGLSAEQILVRDRELLDLSKVVQEYTLKDFSSSAGSGAAGGAGFGVLAFLGGSLLPGAAFFLDLIEFDTLVLSSEIVITGEGSSDLQSIQGKLIGEIAKRTKNKKARVYCLCGRLDLGEKIPDELAHIHFAQINAADAMSRPFIRLKELAVNTLVEDRS